MTGRESQISNLKSPKILIPMPTYQRFEDLPVWQSAAELYDGVDDFLASAPPRLSRSFRDQLERATLSVSNNIAEGFERGTTNELLAFIYIARGSAGEVRSMLTLLARRPWIPANLKSQISDLKSLAESCSRQLRAWADSLQNSPIAGPRHLNAKTRANYEKATARQRGLAAFNALLDQHLPPDHPARKKI
jgi:four helix bundle protein